MAETTIEIDNVNLSLPSRAGLIHILRSITLAVMAGESLAITGPSGSGKTSLLMVMAGLERVSSGRIIVAGQDLTALDEDTLAVARGATTGIVFQSFHLVPTMTAVENVALPLEFQDSADALQRAAEMMTEVGLSHRLQHFPAQLSGGEQQRVALARALVTQPRLLLADEPTGNLDGATGAQVMDLLFAAQTRRNATLVLVTHDEKLASRCSRILRMIDGGLSMPTQQREPA